MDVYRLPSSCSSGTGSRKREWTVVLVRPYVRSDNKTRVLYIFYLWNWPIKGQFFKLLNFVTGSAVALHCCKAHERINRKTGNSTPCKIVTPENFSSKVCTRDYVGDVNYCANFCENRFSGGFSPNRWNITSLWLFWLSCFVLSCPVLSFFLDPAPRSNRCTDFHALWLKRRVSAQGSAFWGSRR